MLPPLHQPLCFPSSRRRLCTSCSEILSVSSNHTKTCGHPGFKADILEIPLFLSSSHRCLLINSLLTAESSMSIMNNLWSWAALWGLSLWCEDLLHITESRKRSKTLCYTIFPWCAFTSVTDAAGSQISCTWFRDTVLARSCLYW